MRQVPSTQSPGCHLCEEALRALEQLRAELSFELRELDITTDEDLHRAYFERIPVVTLDGRELCELHLDERLLRERLGQTTDPSSRVTAMTSRDLTSMAASGPDSDQAAAERLSLGVAARLSRYLQVLTQAQEDGQGDDLLAGALGLHARQLDPDPPGPVGIRQVRQARRRLQRGRRSSRRSARSCARPVSTTSR